MNYSLFPSAALVTLLTLCMPVHAQESAQTSADQSAQPNVPAAQADSLDDMVGHYPPGSIQAVKRADQALADVTEQRARIAEQFSHEEAACYSKFFVTACIDAAKERRRLALAQLKPIEVEANAFKRRDRVVERDRALAEQQAKDEARAAQQAATPKKINPQAVPNPSQEDVNKIEEKGSASAAGSNESFMKTNEERAALHREKMKKAQAKEAAQAEKRAENVRRYEKKVKDSQERQRKIAERKAEEEAQAKEAQSKNTQPDSTAQPNNKAAGEP